MKLRYFAVNAEDQVQKVSQAAVKGLWEGRLRVDALGCAPRNELRLISVACDKTLRPERIYLLRLPLLQGRFTEESYLTLRLFTQPDCMTPAELVQHHTEGWPQDFFPQLAVVLDVPVAALDVPIGIGGPLFLAAALRLTPRQAVRYLR